jgi:hypothetical protein
MATLCPDTWPVPEPPVSQKDVIIAYVISCAATVLSNIRLHRVMGATGTGKSTVSVLTLCVGLDLNGQGSLLI